MKQFALKILFLITCAFSSFLATAQHPFFKQFGQVDGLSGNTVYDIFQSSSGDVWMATDKGVSYFKNDFFQQPAQPKALKSSQVLKVFEDDDKNIWAYNEAGLLFKYHGKTGFKQAPFPNQLKEVVASRIINSLQIEKGDKLSIGTVIGGGLYELNGNQLKHVISSESGEFSYFIRELSSGKFVWGSNGTFPPNNILHIELKGQKPFTINLSDKTNFSKSSFIALSNGSFLFAKGHELIHFNNEEIIQRGFLEQKIESIFESVDEKIWTTLHDGGVICYLTESLNTEISNRYLGSKTIFSVHEDKSGNTWFGSSGEGVFMLPGKNNFTYSAPKIFIRKPKEKLSSGIPVIEKVEPPIDVSISEDPLTDAFKDSIPLDTIFPSVYISHLEINGVDTPVYNLYHLRYDQNFISLNFAGFVKNQPENLQYKYILSPFDEDWVFSNTPNAQYAQLEPGEYVFSVFAMNKNGIWSKQPAKINFFISHPFWKTWLFYSIILTVILFFIILLLFRGFRRSKEKEKGNRQQLMSELKVLRAQMNPHFTFNTLSSIQNYIGSNNNDAAISYLTKFAKLMRSIMENTKKQTISIKDDINALELYLDLEKLRLNNKFSYQVNIGENIDVQYDQIPSMLIQPYVENAIWHGVSHKNGKGMISIDLNRRDQYLVCSIEDNGIGRAASKKLNGKRTKHTSMGMEITKERLEIINSLKNSDLSVIITDLKDGKDMALGTKVELFIPMDDE